MCMFVYVDNLYLRKYIFKAHTKTVTDVSYTQSTDYDLVLSLHFILNFTNRAQIPMSTYTKFHVC